MKIWNEIFHPISEVELWPYLNSNDQFSSFQFFLSFSSCPILNAVDAVDAVAVTNQFYTLPQFSFSPANYGRTYN